MYFANTVIKSCIENDFNCSKSFLINSIFVVLNLSPKSFLISDNSWFISVVLSNLSLINSVINFILASLYNSLFVSLNSLISFKPFLTILDSIILAIWLPYMFLNIVFINSLSSSLKLIKWSLLLFLTSFIP